MTSAWPRENLRKIHDGIRTPADTDATWTQINAPGGGGVEFYEAPGIPAWENVGGPYRSLEFRLDNNGEVIIRGRITKQPASGDNENPERYGDRVFTLPAGYGPEEVITAGPFVVWPLDAPTGIDPLLPGSVMWVASKITNEQPVLSAEVTFRYLAAT